MRVFVLIAVFAQILALAQAFASNAFLDDYYYGKVASFLEGVQGPQKLQGRVFDVDQNGRTVFGDCSDLFLQLTYSKTTIDFKASSMKSGLLIHEIFDQNGDYGDVHLRHINKNNLVISVGHQTLSWRDKERTNLSIQKDDEGRLVRVSFRKFSKKTRLPLLNTDVRWQKGVVCTAK